MLIKPCYVCDFETITRNGIECVWLFDFCNVATLEHITGKNLDEFLEIIDNLKTGSTIYFHNLKFDASFLIDYMLKCGYEISENKSNKLKKYQFNLLVTEFGAFMRMNYKNSNNKIIEFIDSLKLLNASVSKLAKDFNLPILKGEIDYLKEREYNYVPTDNELAYIHNDTEIVARCLQIFLGEGYNKITLSSCAYDDYKKILGTDRFNSLFGKWNNGANLELDMEIRKAYRGGFCQCNKKYINTTIKRPVWYNDVNSLYPYVMYNAKLPYGMPLEFEGEYQQDNEFPYYIQKIKVDMCVKDDGIPCILNKTKGVNCRYIIDTQEESVAGSLVELTLTCFDLELLYKNYDIYNLQFLGGYKFRVKNGMFTEYIDKYYLMKTNADKNGNGAKRAIAKLFLNSLYGKFGQNPVRRNKKPFVDIDGKVKYYRSNPDVAKRFTYLPIAVFITAIARFKVINDIMKIGIDNWVYTDTDSILSLKRFDDNMLDDRELGKYKIEQVFKKTRVLGPKTYWGINTQNEITAKACGCSKKALKNFPIGKFNYGQKVVNGRTTLKTVVGGKKIDFAEFTIKNKDGEYKKHNRDTIKIEVSLTNLNWF